MLSILFPYNLKMKPFVFRKQFSSAVLTHIFSQTFLAKMHIINAFFLKGKLFTLFQLRKRKQPSN